MSKRSLPGETDEGPPSKFKCDEADDGGGRTGRVRKKSAKVLEMEEFEQVEKTNQSKKSKGVKSTPVQSAPKSDDHDASITNVPASDVKHKSKQPKDAATLEKSLMQTPISVKPVSSPKSTVMPSKNSSAAASKLMMQILPDQSVVSAPNATESLLAVIKKEAMEESQNPRQSVIKSLLDTPVIPSPNSKKSSLKKTKPSSEDQSNCSKPVPIKMELEESDESEVHYGNTGLKIRISASSNPDAAQVTLNPSDGTPSSGKHKKSNKKPKAHAIPLSPEMSMAIVKSESDDFSPPPTKKHVKKSSKKKEQLIHEAVLAAQMLPEQDPIPEGKAAKKKKKVKIAERREGDLMSPDTNGDDEIEEESHLVIAETEKKKKKTLTKKKSPKEKAPATEAQAVDVNKKVPKRSPTAYVMFCNTHRPGIVQENPGIDFATISRKLGELWQTLSTKQKLQWRRKAQRRMKRGSNLISTGKTAKPTGPQTATQPPSQSSISTPSQQHSAGALRILSMAGKSPVETPQSPTNSNFSIEPIDVAAHLKLLGESLSIIGMRLQEHKGMIAVQGSLSVLLDSLLCACGPLLCLTQQVPHMDGCDPLLHGQTLDSVAYVMPGL